MGSTKIFVIQLKEVLRSFIYVVIGIVLIILLAYLFIPKKKGVTDPASQAANDVLYAPGTYAIELILTNAQVDLEVEVTESEIVSVKFAELDEQQLAFYPLFDPAMKLLSSEVLRTQSPDVETTSDYEFTNRVLLDAIKVALNSANVANAKAE